MITCLCVCACARVRAYDDIVKTGNVLDHACFKKYLFATGLALIRVHYNKLFNF